MEQEPVYVMSDKLTAVCEAALGKIYDHRRDASQQYVVDRTQEHNIKQMGLNRVRSWFRWLGVKQGEYVTPFGMEGIIQNELRALDQDALQAHPMVGINQSYGGEEHLVKDALIQCAMNESVMVSPDMVRCISHFGLPLDFCKRNRIGFLP